MRKVALVFCLTILTVAAFIIDDELFGLFTVASWALAFGVKLFVAHEEYRSYRAKY